MFVLAYRFRRPDDTRTVYPAEPGHSLRIAAPARLICKWHNSAQGPLVCSWQPLGSERVAPSR